LFPVVFLIILIILPTASVTPLKLPYCISMIISSMPSDHRSCHVFASSIFLPLSIPLTIYRYYLPFISIWFKSIHVSHRAATVGDKLRRNSPQGTERVSQNVSKRSRVFAIFWRLQGIADMSREF